MISKEQYSKPATLAGRLNSDSQWVFDPIYNRPDQERDGGRLRVLIFFLHMSGIAQKLQQESLRASGAPVDWMMKTWYRGREKTSQDWQITFSIERKLLFNALLPFLNF